MYELRPGSTVRVDPKAMTALQDTTEAYVMQLLEDSSKCAVHAKRITLHVTDVTLSQSFTQPP